jgi:hypothetical protein
VPRARIGEQVGHDDLSPPRGLGMLSLTSVNSIISDYFEARYQRVNLYR